MKHLYGALLFLILSYNQAYHNISSDRITCHKTYLHQAEKFKSEGKNIDALCYYRKAIDLDPYDVNTVHAAANLCRDLEQYEQATIWYKQALQSNPHNIPLIFDAANMFTMTNELDSALFLYKKILLIHPSMIEVLYNYAYTLKKKGLLEQAIPLYQNIINARPDYAHAHFGLGLSYLSIGNFEQGWQEYEWRWKAYNEAPLTFNKPSWNGQTLSGKTIFLYAEQGLGDTFQFIRYAQILKEKGARIIFQTQPPLKKILSLCPYIDIIIAMGEPIPPFDYHLPLMSCPFICNTTITTIPHRIPYLYADQRITKEWHTKLSGDCTKHFKVGICWQGNAHYATQFLRKAVAAKSMHINLFAPIAQLSGVVVYSLQKINGTEQLQEAHDLSIKTFGDDFDEKNGRFMDTAAIIQNLDLVITIDTSIGHFAAALGTPTWILLPNPSDWRWMVERNDTPWYQNVRLFRQLHPGDWQSVINEVIIALKKEIL